MDWAKITDIILIAAFAVLGVFAFLGLYQWITRKSLKKVDRSLLAMVSPLGLMAIVYVVFDKIFILSTRPDGSGEPSFPSSHSMIAATIFFITILALPKYVKNKPLRIFLTILMLALTALIAFGRVAANKHYPLDVVCGLVFTAIFATIYYFIANPRKKKEKENE